jgi:putative chitinase
MWPVEERHLVAAGASPANAKRFVPHLLDAMRRFNIDSGERPAMFIAQVAHESGDFQHTVEIWGPTPAQLRYEGRRALGNTEPGDGYRFRGRGLIQITGRANYLDVCRAFLLPLHDGPAWLESASGASHSAAWFWMTHGCNALADAFDLIGVTKRINGGLNGLASRTAKYSKLASLT